MGGVFAGAAPPSGVVNASIGGNPSATMPDMTVAAAAPRPQAAPPMDNQRQMAAMLLGLQQQNPLIRQQAGAMLPTVQAAVQREENNRFRAEDREDRQSFQAQQAQLQREIAAANRAPEPLMIVDGPNGPRYVPRSQAVGQAPPAERGQVPMGYQRTPEGLAPIPGGPADPAVAEARRRAMPVPANVQRAEDEDLQALGTAGTINGELSRFRTQIGNELSGQGAPGDRLALGPVQNLASGARNSAGLSTPNSANYASFRAGIERLRNESLRLNSGVQTDGDAQRAWNELIGNINDPRVVQQRLDEIERLNRRAMDLRGMAIQQRRQNYSLPALDTERFTAPPQAAPTGQAQAGPPAAGGWGIREVR